jgi:hypothetical protein
MKLKHVIEQNRNITKVPNMTSFEADAELYKTYDKIIEHLDNKYKPIK